MPAPDDALRSEALERAVQAAVSHGLTGVHDMGVALADLGLMRRFADAGRRPLRIRADFVILGADPLTAPADDLPALPVLSTWVDGEKVFEAK